MKDVLLAIVQELVDHPEEVEVNESGDDQRKLLTVSVHPDDMGKIIGKSGRIIRALRDLMKILAMKHELYVDIVLEEEHLIDEPATQS